MFDRKSDYALNKKDPEAIVCKSVSGVHIRLTRVDFSSEEEFQRWKDWSDEDYHAGEKSGRSFYDHCVSLEICVPMGSPSAEEIYFDPEEETAWTVRKEQMTAKIQVSLTEKQYQRLYLYYIAGMTEAEIAQVEGVGQQRISASITAARKNIEKIFRKFLRDMR